MVRPSGLHAGRDDSMSRVICDTRLLVRSSTKMLEPLPSRFDTNAMRRPSAEIAGSLSYDAPNVSCVVRPPDTGNSNRCPSMPTISVRPSGDTAIAGAVTSSALTVTAVGAAWTCIGADASASDANASIAAADLFMEPLPVVDWYACHRELIAGPATTREPHHRPSIGAASIDCGTRKLMLNRLQQPP